MNNTYELRNISMTATEENNKYIVAGKAICFGEPTTLYTDRFGTSYREIIDKDALTGVDLSDVPLKYNHDNAKASILARVRDGSLKLELKDDGLYFVAELNTNLGQDVHKAITVGDINKCSFAFICEADTVETDNNTVTRTIQKIKHIGDISIVDSPAYEGTSVEARNSNKPAFILSYEQEREQEERQKLILLTLI